MEETLTPQTQQRLTDLLSLITQGQSVSEEELREIYRLGEECFLFFVFLLQSSFSPPSSPSEETISPSTPSGMIPPYQKPSSKHKKKDPGRKPGHPVARRPKPSRVNKRQDHRLECCPDCGGPLQKCNGPRSVRRRVVEDIHETVEPEITEHVIHRDYCPRCKKPVEPKVDSALPKATLGNRLLVLTAYWHYALGLTLSQIRDTLNYHLQFKVSAGGLIRKWHQLRKILLSWYEELMEEAQQSAVLHADETGWRVNGETFWLWCFTSADITFYMVNRSRGSPALFQFFKESFDGILVVDFWGVYDALVCLGKQRCLPHLLRELEKVNQRNASEEWQAFSKKLKRLLKDAIRLRAREDYTPDRYASRIQRMYNRLLDLAWANYTDKDACRLAKRLEKYWDELFTFLEKPYVPSNNNHGEREIRPAVMIRKMIYGNRSKDGALTQSVLMTVFRTLKRRGYNPINTLVSALREYIQTGKLPPFPPAITSTQ